MIDVIYNARQNTLPTAQFSNEWQNLCNELEGTLTEKQIELLHAMLDIQSDTAAIEICSAYKNGFKDGAALMRELQE